MLQENLAPAGSGFSALDAMPDMLKGKRVALASSGIAPTSTAMFCRETIRVSLWQDVLLLSPQEERRYTSPQLSSLCCGNLPVSASGMLVIASCDTLLKFHLEHLGIPQEALHTTCVSLVLCLFDKHIMPALTWSWHI